MIEFLPDAGRRDPKPQAFNVLAFCSGLLQSTGRDVEGSRCSNPVQDSPHAATFLKSQMHFRVIPTFLRPFMHSSQERVIFSRKSTILVAIYCNCGAITNITVWFHILCVIIVYGTSNGPQNDIGNYLGPCSTLTGRPCLSICDEEGGGPNKTRWRGPRHLIQTQEKGCALVQYYPKLFTGRFDDNDHVPLRVAATKPNMTHDPL